MESLMMLTLKNNCKSNYHKPKQQQQEMRLYKQQQRDYKAMSNYFFDCSYSTNSLQPLMQYCSHSPHSLTHLSNFAKTNQVLLLKEARDLFVPGMVFGEGESLQVHVEGVYGLKHKQHSTTQ